MSSLMTRPLIGLGIQQPATDGPLEPNNISDRTTMLDINILQKIPDGEIVAVLSVEIEARE